jgi:hypothetical protein
MAITYEPIATTTLATATTDVTFSTISGSYTDLILVANITGAENLSSGALSCRFNSDTGTNYSQTNIEGNGITAASARASNDNRMIVGSPSVDIGNHAMTNIINIMGYSNTTTYKTVLSRSSIAASQVAALVGLWRSTAAITSITYGTYNSQTLSAGSTFTLYGIKSA